MPASSERDLVDLGVDPGPMSMAKLSATQVALVTSEELLIMESRRLIQRAPCFSAIDRCGHFRIAIDTAGQRLATPQSIRDVAIWDLATLSIKHVLRPQGVAYGAIFMGDSVFTAGEYGGTAQWALATGKPEWVLWDSPSVTQVANNPLDPEIVAIAGQFGHVWLLRPNAQQVNFKMQATHARNGRPEVTALAWHPDGQHLAVALDTDTHDAKIGPCIVVLDTHTGMQSRRLWGHNAEVSSLLFRQGHLLSGSRDGTVKTWSDEQETPRTSLDVGIPIVEVTHLADALVALLDDGRLWWGPIKTPPAAL